MKELSPHLANELILVVDDAEFNRYIIAHVLTQHGFTNIETAVDGRDALEKTYRMKPSLVLLDLLMPDIDGFHYCEHVRRNKNFDFMPIIVQTSSENREHKLRALSSGADDFLYKPFDQTELFLRVCIHMERHALLREMDQTRQYLSLELEHAQNLLQDVEQANVDESVVVKLHKHCKVLETMQMLHDDKIAKRA